PPNSTLFPYTTLFRSQLRFRVGGRRARRLGLLRQVRFRTLHALVQLVQRLLRPHELLIDRVLEWVTDVVLHPLDHADLDAVDLQDRKSTRLNSSHVAI